MYSFISPRNLKRLLLTGVVITAPHMSRTAAGADPAIGSASAEPGAPGFETDATGAESSFDNTRFGAVSRTLHDYHVIIGAGVAYAPKYEGSSEYGFSPVPFISAEFFDRLTVGPGGIGVKVYEQGPLKLSAKLGYEGGRKEKDAGALSGMGDIGAGAKIGGRASYDFGPVKAFVEVDKIVGGSNGTTGKIGASIEQPIAKQWILGAEASASFADNNYMRSYFGVSADQSARTGYNEYKPKAGIKSVDLAVSATYLIDEHWTLRAEQKVGTLVGDAANSPIVRNKVQSESMLMLGYRF